MGNHLTLRWLPLIAVIGLSACSRWQIRADEIQSSVDIFVEEGHRQKDDFIRKFGIPASCAPLKTGELCEWQNQLGYQGGSYTNHGYTASSAARVSETIRVEFDSAGTFVNAATFVQRGGRQYQGRNEKDAPPPCPEGQEIRYDKCYPIKPIFGASKK